MTIDSHMQRYHRVAAIVSSFLVHVYVGLFRTYYIDDMFKHDFGDTPSGVYGIYVVFHVAYGRTYVEVA